MVPSVVEHHWRRDDVEIAVFLADRIDLLLYFTAPPMCKRMNSPRQVFSFQRHRSTHPIKETASMLGISMARLGMINSQQAATT